jgi:threonyl-tRNA synthetase
LWLPNGGVMIEELEKLAKDMEDKAGYLRVKTPHLTKEDLFIRSGHLPYYAESMYPPMELEGVKYYVKPMNCPMHHKIFGSKGRSYRDLPIRLAEYGTCYRYEKSGELFGLMRVRSMQMNDAHIYVSEDQFEEEFLAVVDMYRNYFDLFGIEKYVMRLSLHGKAGLGKKYVDNERLWLKTEEMVRRIGTIQDEVGAKSERRRLEPGFCLTRQYSPHGREGRQRRPDHPCFRAMQTRRRRATLGVFHLAPHVGVGPGLLVGGRARPHRTPEEAAHRRPLE